MGQSRIYKGIIFTNHALERLGQRQFTQDMVADTVLRPDKKINGKKPQTIEYTRSFGKSTVTVIVGTNQEGAPLVLSTWIDPPMWGTHDYHKRNFYTEYRKSGFWKRLLLNLRYLVFGR